MVRGTFAADRIVSVEAVWNGEPCVDGILMEEPRYAEVIKSIVEGENAPCSQSETHCGAYVGPFLGEDWLGNEKYIWNDFYVTEVDGEVKAYCVDCIDEVAPV